jgi:hypothetical protein
VLEKDGAAGQWAQRALANRVAGPVLAESEANLGGAQAQAGPQGLAAGPVLAESEANLAGAQAQAGLAVLGPELESAPQGLAAEPDRAWVPQEEVVLEGEQGEAAADWRAELGQRESEAVPGGAPGLAAAAAAAEKGQVLADGCLEVRMTNRFIGSCVRWRRLEALERARIHPRLRWSFRIRCRNCLGRRRRR